MSHDASSFAPASSRAASSIGRINRIGHGNPAASKASVRFGFTAVILPQSTVRCGFGSAVAILPAALRSRGNLPDELGAEKTFAVILKNDRVELGQDFAQTGGHLRDLLLAAGPRIARDRPARPVDVAR